MRTVIAIAFALMSAGWDPGEWYPPKPEPVYGFGDTNSTRPRGTVANPTPGNSPPFISAQSAIETAEEVAVEILVTDFTIVDPDGPGPNTITCVDGLYYSISGSNGCIITPDAAYTGPLTVPVTPNDGQDDGPAYNATVTVVDSSLDVTGSVSGSGDVTAGPSILIGETGDVSGSGSVTAVPSVAGGACVPCSGGEQCCDCLDNDGDTFFDFKEDRGCYSPTDNTEGGTSTNVQDPITTDYLFVGYEPVFEHSTANGGQVTFVHPILGTDDPGNCGGGRDNPVATANYCVSDCVDDGQQDWCFLLEGQSYALNMLNRSGRSLTEPILITTYALRDISSGPMNRAVITSLSNTSSDYLVLMNLDMTASDYFGFLGTSTGLALVHTEWDNCDNGVGDCWTARGNNALWHNVSTGVMGTANSIFGIELADFIFYGNVLHVVTDIHTLYAARNSAATSGYVLRASHNLLNQAAGSGTGGNILMMRAGGEATNNVLNNAGWLSITAGACNDSGGTGTCGNAPCEACLPNTLNVFDNNFSSNVGINHFGWGNDDLMDASTETTWQSTDQCLDDSAGAATVNPGLLASWTYSSHSEQTTESLVDYCNSQVGGACTNEDWFYAAAAADKSYGGTSDVYRGSVINDWFRRPAGQCNDCTAVGGPEDGLCSGPTAVVAGAGDVTGAPSVVGPVSVTGAVSGTGSIPATPTVTGGGGGPVTLLASTKQQTGCCSTPVVAADIDRTTVGTNRTLILACQVTRISFSYTSVTYGGQAMTEQLDSVWSDRSVAIFTLNDAGIGAATNNTFVITTNNTTFGNSCYSMIYGNVDQTTPVSAIAAPAPNTNLSFTSAVSPGANDLAIAWRTWDQGSNAGTVSTPDGTLIDTDSFDGIAWGYRQGADLTVTMTNAGNPTYRDVQLIIEVAP